MKGLLFIPAITLITIFSSCKKDSSSNSTTSGTISADIDGTAVSFNFGDNAALDTISGEYTIAIAGFQSGVNVTSNEIGIGVGGAYPIAVGTYTDTSSIADNSTISYSIPSDNSGYAAVGIAPFYGTVTITSISATQVQGTFSGVLGVGSGSSSTVPYHTLTNGKFNVKITHL